jgi:hypothetical protein
MRPAMRLSMTQQDSFHVNFYEPKEGKLNGFFTVRESEKMKKEDSREYLFCN